MSFRAQFNVIPSGARNLESASQPGRSGSRPRPRAPSGARNLIRGIQSPRLNRRSWPGTLDSSLRCAPFGMTGACAPFGMTGACAPFGMTGACAPFGMTWACAPFGMTWACASFGMTGAHAVRGTDAPCDRLPCTTSRTTNCHALRAGQRIALNRARTTGTLRESLPTAACAGYTSKVAQRPAPAGAGSSGLIPACAAQPRPSGMT